MRVPQKRGERGSLKWIQGIAEDPEHPVARGIREQLRIPSTLTVGWRSPRADDDFSEYRDASFLDALGLGSLSTELLSFWPERGPQWDALGLLSDGRILLVEAKAHITEMISSCEAGPRSREMIERALESAKKYYAAAGDRDWLQDYYQYANRLAHLQFLRERGIDAHFVGVYFLGDHVMRGPTEIGAWAKAIDDCHESLGLAPERPLDFVHHVFVRVPEGD
jgi:hypothetical protein